MIRKYLQVIAGFNPNVRLLLLRTIVMGMYSGVYGIIFNLYILEMGYKTDFLGLLLAVSLLASSATSIPAGILCDRFDRRALLVGSSSLAALSVLPIFCFHSPYVLLAFSALSGFFSAISAVCLTPMLAENCNRDSTVHVFSANASMGWIASVTGCALGGILPGIWLGFVPGGVGRSYQLTLLTSVLLLTVGCGLALLLRKNACEHRAPKKPAFSLEGLRPSGTVLKFTLTNVTFGVASGMIVPYFNVYFMKAVNMGVLEIGLTSAAAGAVMIVGFVLTPILTARIGKVRSAVFTKIVSAPFLVLMAFTRNLVLVAGAYVAYMFLINMAGPATTSFQMEQIKPREQGYAVGLMATGSCLAVSASSFVSGVLIARGNFSLPFVLTCAGYLATAALLYYYFKDTEALPGRRQKKQVTT